MSLRVPFLACSFVVLSAVSLEAQVDVEVLFRVDMSVQIELERFDPNLDFVVMRGTPNSWGCSEAMLESEDDENIYELWVQIPAHQLGAGEFKFNINCGKGASGRWEDSIPNRIYQVNAGLVDTDDDGFVELELEPVFFDNAIGGSNAEITFSVDMSLQEDLGAFDAASDLLVVRGSFNGWGCSVEMIETDEDGIWEITIPIRGHQAGNSEFKFNIGCLDTGYENSISNRSYTFRGTEPDRDGDGFREVRLPTVYFDDVEPGPDVEFLFKVRMEGALEEGLFNPDVDDIFVRGSFGAWACGEVLEELDDGIWQIAVQTEGHPTGTGRYKFNLNCLEEGYETDVSDRLYTVTGDEPDVDEDGYLEIALPEVIDFNNLTGNIDLPDVEFIFQVDMSIEIEEGRFDPVTQDVFVRGDINGWACSDPMGALEGEPQVYEIRIPVFDQPAGSAEYKFNVGCSDIGWEDEIPNRSYAVTGAEIDTDDNDLVEVNVAREVFDNRYRIEDCCNGIDDDLDGLTDFDDSDCVAAPDNCGHSDAILVRGDADASGQINLTDGISILLWSFQGDKEPACLDAADVDNSGAINLTDPIRIFQWLFLGGATFAPPSPDAAAYSMASCGVDNDDDPFDCSTPTGTCGQ